MLLRREQGQRQTDREELSELREKVRQLEATIHAMKGGCNGSVHEVAPSITTNTNPPTPPNDDEDQKRLRNLLSSLHFV
jgi:hypothetical protein